MNVLWITNTIFPEPSKYLNILPPIICGWMYGLADALTDQNIKLSVATTYKGSELKKIEVNNIIYYLLPLKGKKTEKLEPLWKQVVSECKPEIIHIHGTECAFGMACIKSNPEQKYVISIQALVSILARCYYTGLNFKQILWNITFRDIIKLDTIWNQRNYFYKKGLIEKEYLRKVRHVIGRTNWDYSHCTAVNPEIEYHFCNECLRHSFYTAQKWDIQQCERHTIFLSQAGYTIKGLHKFIAAVSILINHFPNLKVYVGGHPLTKTDTFSARIRVSGYGKIIRGLIKKNKLTNHFVFLGALKEHQMVAQYQKAHAFVCPSVVENSPNSLGEAQIIGTPCVASYVGGISDMIEHGESGFLYPFDDVEVLANYVKRIFENDALAVRLSQSEITEAEKRHDRVTNVNETLRIYRAVSNS